MVSPEDLLSAITAKLASEHLLAALGTFLSINNANISTSLGQPEAVLLFNQEYSTVELTGKQIKTG